MKYKITFFLLLLLVIVSCTDNKRYDSLLQRADSLMDSNDSLAEAAISQLDSINPQLADFSNRQKMRYALLRHKAMNKANIPMTSDSVMKEVVEYYDRNGSANERMLANYVLGCVYRDLHEAPMALEYYNKATEQADTTATDCDYGTLYRIYSQMGYLFAKQYFPYQLFEAFGKAEKYAYLAKDTFNAIVNYQNTGDAYYCLEKKDSLIAINLRTASMFKQIGDDYNAAIALGCNYRFYIEKKDTINAKKAFAAYNSTRYEGNSNYKDSKAYVLWQKGTYFLFVNQLDSAYINFIRSLKFCKSYSIKAAISKGLAEYYTKIKQPTLATKYAIQSAEYNDSDLIEARKSQLQQMQALYDYSRNQEMAKKAEQKVEGTIQIIYMIILAFIMLLLLLFYIHRKKMTLKKKRIEISKLLYEDSLLKLKRLQYEKDKLVADNNNKLSQVITEKEFTINKLKTEINNIQEKYSLSPERDADLTLNGSSIYKKIKFIEVHPKKEMCEDDWKELAETVEKAIPDFIPRLKDKVNDKDYRICLLIRLGFSTSFMARILGVSGASICKSRKTMLKKLCGKSGKPKEFDEFVLRIGYPF